jgi:hypothetical protein
MSAPLRAYLYQGDRWTREPLKGMLCFAVLRPDGKCIRGKNGSMLVRGFSGTCYVVPARRLRKKEMS